MLFLVQVIHTPIRREEGHCVAESTRTRLERKAVLSSSCLIHNCMLMRRPLFRTPNFLIWKMKRSSRAFCECWRRMWMYFINYRTEVYDNGQWDRSGLNMCWFVPQRIIFLPEIFTENMALCLLLKIYLAMADSYNPRQGISAAPLQCMFSPGPSWPSNSSVLPRHHSFMIPARPL